MMNQQLDPRLPKLNNVKAVPSSTSVAFEWQPVSTKGLDGINIYRTKKNAYVQSQEKELIKVGSVTSPFASHYVDKGLAQNSAYTYTFTTIKGGFESSHGQIVNVKTLPPFGAVTFFQGFQKASNTIKLIWRPHSNKMVKMYKVEKSINGGKWKWIASVNNRMMSEYIDTYVAPGSSYTYRVIAVGFDDSFSQSSKVITIHAR
jgi:fibronectin type 3 domain-containing protein